MKIKYTTMIVKDIEETSRFYTENFKLEKIEEFAMPDKFKMVMLTDGDNVLELIENNEKSTISSIGIEVDNLNETITKLEKEKIEFINKPKDNNDIQIATFLDLNGLKISLSEKKK